MPDPLPHLIGLCPVHLGEFYMPLDPGESEKCPECDQDMAIYVPRESRNQTPGEGGT